MGSAAGCRLCALAAGAGLETGPYTVLIAACDGVAGELWIVPKRHVSSMLDARAGEWLEILAMTASAPAHRVPVDGEVGFRFEIEESWSSAVSASHLYVRLVPLLDPPAA